MNKYKDLENSTSYNKEQNHYDSKPLKKWGNEIDESSLQIIQGFNNRGFEVEFWSTPNEEVDEFKIKFSPIVIAENFMIHPNFVSIEKCFDGSIILTVKFDKISKSDSIKKLEDWIDSLPVLQPFHFQLSCYSDITEIAVRNILNRLFSITDYGIDEFSDQSTLIVYIRVFPSRVKEIDRELRAIETIYNVNYMSPDDIEKLNNPE